ncbi:MAG: hypothetical protein KA293_03160 [Bacteroidia bacterium]|nr:hypothetical protein [Bacteroidia bacterium]
MSLRILSAFLLCATFTLTACSRKPIDPTIPEALQDSNSNSEYSFELKSRESNDLVGELFAEILEKRPEVKKIVDEQAKLLEDINEQMTQLHEFDGKSNQYYASAKSHANSILDSLSSISAMEKIEASEARWHASLAQRDAMSASLSQKRQTLSDEMRRLKIRLTLPQIEDFQRKHKPNLDTAAALEKRHSALLKSMQTIPTE